MGFSNVESNLLGFPRLSEKSFVLFIRYPPDFVSRLAASKPKKFHPENKFDPEIHEVDLWQV